MKSKNTKSLLRLSIICRYAGYIFISIGLLVISIDTINQDWFHLQSGILIFAAGYTYIKIGTRISSILFDERTESNN